MYMVADIEKMTGDPRLRPVLAANVETLTPATRNNRLTPFWMRFADPHAPLPFITDLRTAAARASISDGLPMPLTQIRLTYRTRIWPTCSRSPNRTGEPGIIKCWG